MGLADWTRILGIALVWGSAFFLIEICLRDTGPFTLVAARLTLGAIALLLYCWATGIRIAVSSKLVAGFAFMGLFGNTLPFTFIALGQTQIASGLTAILIATTPLFTVLVGHLWKRTEPATASKLTGVIAGFLGVMVLMGLDALFDLASSGIGQLAILVAAFSYAISAVFGRRFRDIPSAATAAGMLVTSSLMAIPVAFIMETPFAIMPSIASIASMISLGILSTSLAYVLYFKVLANAGATNAMLVTIIQPPIAILLGTTFLGEVLEPNQMFGLLLILAGLILVDGRLVRHVLQRV